MKTPLVATGSPARTRLSAFGKLTVAAVIGLVLAAIVTGIMVATRWRWSPLLGAVVYVLVLAGERNQQCRHIS